MHPFLIALIIVVLGLGVCFLSGHAGPTLSRVFWWSGILVAVLGLLILIFPVLHWIYRNLTEAFAI